MEVPKIQIKYVPVVVKNKEEDPSSEVELGPAGQHTTEIPIEKSTNEMRQVDSYTKSAPPSKYPEPSQHHHHHHHQSHSIQGTIYVPQGVNSHGSSYSTSPSAVHNYPSQTRQYSALYRHRQAPMQQPSQENVYHTVSQGRHSSSYSMGHHLNHMDHLHDDPGAYGVTNALNHQNIGIEYAG